RRNNSPRASRSSTKSTAPPATRSTRASSAASPPTSAPRRAELHDVDGPKTQDIVEFSAHQHGGLSVVGQRLDRDLPPGHFPASIHVQLRTASLTRAGGG